MGQSVSQYTGNYFIILRGNFLNIDGIGPAEGNVKFSKTGQSLKLLSVVSTIDGIYGYNNNYYQILFNNISEINMESQLINQNIAEQILPTYENEIKTYNPNI